jgi:hypothetical protein
VLIDVRGISDLPESAAMRTLADRFVTTPVGTGKRALVADSDAVFGMLRMLSTLADRSPNEWRAFRLIEKAEEWLSE